MTLKIDNINKLNCNVDTVNTFIFQESAKLKRTKRFQIENLDTMAKDTLLKVEKYLLEHPDSRIDYMTLSADELDYLAEEISKI